jgi:peptidoglycan/LPS O-acetylase OafA/YrhL
MCSQMDAIKINTKSLEGLRGFSSLIVVLSHCSKRGSGVLPWIDFSGTGKIAVWAFFVLSAFLLTRSLLESGVGARSLASYFIRRGFRIYPMFITALLIELSLDRIPLSRVIDAFLLINAPNIFWTVPVEFQYYFFMPIVVALYIRLGCRLVPCLFLTAILVGLSMALDLPAIGFWTFLPTFLAGSFGALLLENSPLNRILLSILSVIGLGAAVLATPAVLRGLSLDSLISINDIRLNHVLFGILFVPIVLGCALGIGWLQVLGTKPFQFLGKISFSLYLLHPLAVDYVRTIPALSAFRGFTILIIAVAAAFLAWFAIEKPCRIFGQRLAQRVRERGMVNFFRFLVPETGNGVK